MYSYNRTTFGSSSEASTAASARNIAATRDRPAGSRCRYLTATRMPELSCLASTTSPNPAEPSTLSSVYPGTLHSGMPNPPRPARPPTTWWLPGSSGAIRLRSVDIELVSLRVLHPDRVMVEPFVVQWASDGGAEAGEAGWPRRLLASCASREGPSTHHWRGCRGAAGS